MLTEDGDDIAYFFKRVLIWRLSIESEGDKNGNSMKIWRI